MSNLQKHRLTPKEAHKLGVDRLAGDIVYVQKVREQVDRNGDWHEYAYVYADKHGTDYLGHMILDEDYLQEGCYGNN